MLVTKNPQAMQRVATLLLILLVLQTSPSAAQILDPTPTPVAGTDSPPAVPDAVEVSPVNRDEEIAARLQGILEATDWFEAPGVVVENGVVFLAGQTQQESYRTWAGELASKTRDVAAVVNRITVIEGSPWDVTPAFEEVEELIRGGIRMLPPLALAVAVLILAWVGRGLVVRMARPILARRLRSPLLIDIGARAAAVPLLLLGIYLALQFLGWTRLALTVLGGTGIAGLIVGIAFRDTVENLLASILLSTDKPFNMGDTVQIGQRTGVVQSLTARATILMGFDGNFVQIPNATVYKSEIVNYTANPNQRFTFTVTISRSSLISEAQEVIMAAVTSHPAVLSDPEPLVLADRFNGPAVELVVNYWIDNNEHAGLKVKSAVIRLVRRALRDAGVEIANPAQEVLLPDAALGQGPQPVLHLASTRDADAPLVAEETTEPVTPSEGGLTSEDEQLQKQADHSRDAASGKNLLTG